MMQSDQSIKAGACDAGDESRMQYGQRQGLRQCRYCTEWVIGLGLSAVVTVGLSIWLKPTFEIGAVLFTAIALIFILALYWRQTAFSAIGLAFKRQRYQRDVVMKLIDSNETISLVHYQ